MADLSAVDYPLTGPPTISFATFEAVLRNAGSPASGEAAAMWSAATNAGLDPGVLLGVFQHESSFGKAGIAVGRHNGFGSRYYSGMCCGAVNAGGWASFPNWAAGATYTARLLTGSMYAGNPSYDTVRKFPYRYAPSSDGNSPAAYGSALVAAITNWRGGTTTGSVPTSAATSAPTAVATSATTTYTTDQWNQVVACISTKRGGPIRSIQADLVPDLTACAKSAGIDLSAVSWPDFYGKSLSDLRDALAAKGVIPGASIVPDVAAILAALPDQLGAIAGHMVLLVLFVAFIGGGAYLVARS